MRPTTFALGLSRRYMLVVVMTAMLASPAWAGIKAPVRFTRGDNEQRLKAAGWTVTFNNRDLLKYALPDKAALQLTANELVGRSVHSLPDNEAAQISSATKHAIARIAREAFAQATMEEREIIKTGQIGSLLYKVGAMPYYAYREGEKPSFVTPWGLSPFVALMPAGQARALEAKITVWFPYPFADAEIFFDGEPTTQTGHERVFVTPFLDVGKSYQYVIVARRWDKGKEVKESQKVTVAGGDSVRVEFYFYKEKPILSKWMRHTGGRAMAEECSFAYSPDRKTVLRVLDKGADTPKSIRLYDVATDKPLGPEIALKGRRVTALAVAPDGKTVATALSPDSNHSDAKVRVWDAEVRVWDATTGDWHGGFCPVRRAEIFDLAFLQNGKFVLIIGHPKWGK